MARKTVQGTNRHIMRSSIFRSKTLRFDPELLALCSLLIFSELKIGRQSPIERSLYNFSAQSLQKKKLEGDWFRNRDFGYGVRNGVATDRRSDIPAGHPKRRNSPKRWRLKKDPLESIWYYGTIMLGEPRPVKCVISGLWAEISSKERFSVFGGPNETALGNLENL